MILTSLLVRNFRLIKEASLSLRRGIQIVEGLNAQGKTSLIEAILFLATSTSHRTRREDELIRWGEETAFLRGQVESASASLRIECGLEKRRKLIKLDGAVLPRVGDLYGHLRVVLFAPEDLEIIAGSPQDRRRFLDMAIAQRRPSYITLLQRFRKALRHRNHILKQLQQRARSTSLQELEVWDQPFLDSAADVVSWRCQTVQKLAPLVNQFYEGLASDGPLAIGYPFGIGMEREEIHRALNDRLRRSRPADIERGATHIGPHRDDPTLHLNEKNLAHFGSQGQRRASALALRLAEARLCAEETGAQPLLLIDDVVHEMDNIRKARFWEQVDLAGQLIVTATDRGHLGAGLEPTSVFQVRNGKIHSD